MTAANLVLMALAVVAGSGLVLSENCASDLIGTYSSRPVDLPPVPLAPGQPTWKVEIPSDQACLQSSGSNAVGVLLKVCEEGNWPAPKTKLQSLYLALVQRYSIPQTRAWVYTTVYCNDFPIAVHGMPDVSMSGDDHLTKMQNAVAAPYAGHFQ